MSSIRAFIAPSNDRQIAQQKARANKQPFCAFCFDIGMPPSKYTSHYVRETPDISSRTTCPELRATACKGCGKRGHTIRNCANKEFCMGEKIRHGVDAPYKNRHNKSNQAPIQTKIQPKNLYSLLDEEEDSDQEQDQASTVTEAISVTEESIDSSATTENEVSLKTYAAVLMSVLKPQPKQEQQYDFSCFKNTKIYKCWADADDDDSDEE